MHAVSQNVFSHGHVRINWLQYVVSGLLYGLVAPFFFFCTWSEPYLFVIWPARNLSIIDINNYVVERETGTFNVSFEALDQLFSAWHWYLQAEKISGLSGMRFYAVQEDVYLEQIT